MALAIPHQFKTLLEIRDLILHDIRNFERIKRFITLMCREDHFDNDTHQKSLQKLEKDKAAGLHGIPHFKISSKPSFLQPRSNQAQQPSLWESDQDDEECRGKIREAVDKDAARYKEQFEKHAQLIFSHTQHHWHHEHDGQRVPHPYCRKKERHSKRVVKRRTNKEEICKQDFPKTKLINDTSRVVCLGVARGCKLKV